MRAVREGPMGGSAVVPVYSTETRRGNIAGLLDVRGSCWDWNVNILKISRRILVVYLLVQLTGCAVATQIGTTQRSSMEQRLLVRSFERALDSLDIHELTGKTVNIDFYGLSPDKDFANEFFTAWLQAHQVQIANDPKQAQFHLKVFAPVLAVDQGQSFVGAPSFTVPILGFAIPEITLFKDVRHSGHAEVEIYTLDGRTGQFVDKSTPAIGESQYDDYTIMIVVHFTRSDIEEQKWGWQPGS